MNKLNLFVAMSAIALFIGQAHAIQFDTENPFSEGNEQLAHRLYRGAYQTLENEPKQLSPAAKDMIAMKDKEHQYGAWNEREEHKEAIYWASKDPYWAGRANELQHAFNRRWDNNNRVEEEMLSMKLNNLYLSQLDVSYRNMEAFKRTTQDLYNAYGSYKRAREDEAKLQTEETAAAVSNLEAKVREKLTLVQYLLSQFTPGIIDVVLANSDAQ